MIVRLLRHVRPETRVRAAGWLLEASLVAWPVSQLTVAQGEPPFVLGLSWLAIIVTCVDVIVSTDIRAEQEDRAP